MILLNLYESNVKYDKLAVANLAIANLEKNEQNLKIFGLSECDPVRFCGLNPARRWRNLQCHAQHAMYLSL